MNNRNQRNQERIQRINLDTELYAKKFLERQRQLQFKKCQVFHCTFHNLKVVNDVSKGCQNFHKQNKSNTFFCCWKAIDCPLDDVQVRFVISVYQVKGDQFGYSGQINNFR